MDDVALTLDPQVSRREPAREAQAPAQLAPSPGAPRAKDAVRVCAGDQAMMSCNAGSREAAPERVPLLRGLDPCLLATGPALTPPPASLRGPAVLAESVPPSRAPDRLERPPRV